MLDVGVVFGHWVPRRRRTSFGSPPSPRAPSGFFFFFFFFFLLPLAYLSLWLPTVSLSFTPLLAHKRARAHTVQRPDKRKNQTQTMPFIVYIYILLAFYLFQTRNIFLLHGIVDGSIYTAVPWRATGISIFPNCSGKNISIQDRRTEELKKRERLELDTPWPRKPPFFFSFVCNS